MVQGGYQGTIAEIDLSEQRVTERDLPDEEVLQQFVGEFPLGLRMLDERVEPGTDPLGPDNPMVFLTGPLTGIKEIPAPTNSTITTINADTGFTVGRSHSHGWFGPRLKKAGYDGIILTGVADDWTYLWIDDGEIEFRDATDLLGNDTHETDSVVAEDLGFAGDHPGEVSVAAIGPAGENECDGALIANDENHSFSHAGVGAIMGSKRLKAIAVRGTGEVPVDDRATLRDVAAEWTDSLEESDVVLGLQQAGIPNDEYEYAKANSITTAKNMLEVPDTDHEWGQGMTDHDITPKPCFGCPIACSYDFEYVAGPNEGYVATTSGGGENLEGGASIAGVYDTHWVHYLTDRCDRLGFESSTIGTAIAVAIEAFEEGLIDEDDTGGLTLEWGDPELVDTLLEKAAHRDGTFGDVLAKGPKRTAEWIGYDAPDRAVHVKGAGMNLHDWRAAWGIMLGQIVGGGTGWPAPGADAWAAPADAGYDDYQEPLDWKNKPQEVVDTWPVKYWDDTHGTCWFSTWGVPGQVDYSARAIAAATGWDFTEEDAREVGERAVHFERAFNAKLGLEAADDLDVPERIVEEPPAGIGEGHAMKDHLEWMVKEVYRLNGWDEKTGKPRRDTLEGVGLEEVAADVWG
jgi:aldehyde:ferredoxin oxidoreductase